MPAAARAADVQLVAVADPAASRREHVAPTLPGFESAQAMIAEGGVDCLVLATPAAEHLADAQVAARAGLSTLIEKPPAADAPQAALMRGLDPPPCIGFNRRFEPGVEQLREVLPADEAFDLRLEHRGRRDAWSPYVVRDDALLTLGPHLLDLVRWLSGRSIEAVRAPEVSERRARLELGLSSGRADVECRLDRPRRERIEVRRAGGGVVARRSAGGLVRSGLARLRPAGEGSLVPSLTAQLEAFARTTQGQSDPRLGTAEDGVAVMAAIDAARRSAARGGSWQPVSVPQAR